MLNRHERYKPNLGGTCGDENLKIHKEKCTKLY